MKTSKLVVLTALTTGMVIGSGAIASATPVQPAKTIKTVSHQNVKIKTGLQTENGNLYLYNQEGRMEYGLQVVNNKVYFFNPQTGAAESGNVKIGDSTYQFNPSTHALAQPKNDATWINYNGHKYFYYNNKPAVGFVKWSNWGLQPEETYYFLPNGQALTGTQTFENPTYNPDFAGNPTADKYWVGHFSAQGTLQYLNTSNKAEGGIYPYTIYKDKAPIPGIGQPKPIVKPQILKEEKGNLYLYNENGEKEYGLQAVNDKVYFFNPQTGAAESGNVKIGDKTYYFNPSTYALAQPEYDATWINYNGHKYFYYNNKPAVGFVKWSNWGLQPEETYYFLPNGQALTGTQSFTNPAYNPAYPSNPTSNRFWVGKFSDQGVLQSMHTSKTSEGTINPYTVYKDPQIIPSIK